MSKRVFFGAILAVAIVTGTTTAVVASHQFPDVPDSNPFHDQISAMADAGITTGYANGDFGPGDNVTRQAMAAFLGRGLGRVAVEESLVSLNIDSNDSAWESEETVTLTAGAEGSGNGYALVTASFHAYTSNEENCPCEMQFRIRDDFDGARTGSGYEQLDDQAGQDGFSFASSTVTGVFEMGAGETHTFHAEALVDDSDVSSVSARVQLTAVYIPFGDSLSGAAVIGAASADAQDPRP